MNMVLKSPRPFLLHQILDMPLCLCMSRKTNEGMMDGERDRDRGPGVCIICDSTSYHTGRGGCGVVWGVISVYNSKHNTLMKSF